MPTSLTKYQKGGIYPWANTRIIPALKEIARAVGAPDVLISSYQSRGVGLHKTGEAADFQAGLRGSKNVDAIELHNRIAKYALENWVRLRIRYMAWDGYEYGGSWGGPERKRKQTTNYGGTDPWHKNHVHIDFLPGNIPGANPNIKIGAALQSAVEQAKDIIQAFEGDTMKLIETPDGKVWVTNGMEKRYVSTPAILNELSKLFGEKPQKISSATGDSIPTRQNMSRLRTDVEKIKAEVGRSAGRERDLITTTSTLMDATGLIISEVHDPESKRTFRTRMEQTNAAVGRAEKARQEAAAKEEAKEEASD